MHKKVNFQLKVDAQLRKQLNELLLELRKLAHMSNAPFQHKGSIRAALVVETALRFLLKSLEGAPQPHMPGTGVQKLLALQEFLGDWLKEGAAASVSDYLSLRGSLAVLGAISLKSQSSPPWRHTSDLYKLYVAEVLLRHTERKQMGAVYKDIMQHYPTAAELAKAPAQQVQKLTNHLKLAEGLIAGADYITKNDPHLRALAGNGLGSLRKHLKMIPLIGDYTADALALHAFGLISLPLNRGAVRVLWRALKGCEPPNDLKDPYRNTDLERMRQRLFMYAPPRTAQLTHFALLDIGWVYCKPRCPRCNMCPVAPTCKYSR